MIITIIVLEAFPYKEEHELVNESTHPLNMPNIATNGGLNKLTHRNQNYNNLINQTNE